jgi:hypothetical protein
MLLGLWAASNRVIATIEGRITAIEVRMQPLWDDYVKARNSP